MIKAYHRTSYWWGIPGSILEFTGFVLSRRSTDPNEILVGYGVLFAGVVLLTVGILFYLRSIGRSPLWCFLGIPPLVGPVVALVTFNLLQDHAGDI